MTDSLRKEMEKEKMVKEKAKRTRKVKGESHYLKIVLQRHQKASPYVSTTIMDVVHELKQAKGATVVIVCVSDVMETNHTASAPMTTD